MRSSTMNLNFRKIPLSIWFSCLHQYICLSVVHNDLSFVFTEKLWTSLVLCHHCMDPAVGSDTWICSYGDFLWNIFQRWNLQKVDFFNACLILHVCLHHSTHQGWFNFYVEWHGIIYFDINVSSHLNAFLVHYFNWY